MIENKLREFIKSEMDDGALFEDILEEFDIDCADLFVMLFNQGLLDEEQLHAYIMDIE